MKLLNSCIVIILVLLTYLLQYDYLSKTSFSLFFFLKLFIWFVLIPAECDLLLLFYEYFGKSVEDLKGKVIWITGASQGIGEALALNISKTKVKLVISARSEDKLNEVKDKCIKQGIIEEKDILVVPFDMIDYNKHELALSTILNHFGKLDILISNAGRSQRARWEKIEVPVDRAIFELNVFALVSLCRIVTEHFIAVGQGHHAIVSSTCGKIGVPMSASYTASKHALSGYFECLRSEQGSKGVTVTMLCAGPVETKLMAGCLREKLGEKVDSDREGKRMTADTFAQHALVAIANKLSEVWICANPVLFIMYLAQYNPTFTRWICNNTDYSSLAMKMRDGTEKTLSKSD